MWRGWKRARSRSVLRQSFTRRRFDLQSPVQAKTTSCSRTGGLIMVVFNLSKKPGLLQSVKGGSW